MSICILFCGICSIFSLTLTISSFSKLFISSDNCLFDDMTSLSSVIGCPIVKKAMFENELFWLIEYSHTDRLDGHAMRMMWMCVWVGAFPKKGFFLNLMFDLIGFVVNNKLSGFWMMRRTLLKHLKIIRICKYPKFRCGAVHEPSTIRVFIGRFLYSSDHSHPINSHCRQNKPWTIKYPVGCTQKTR